MIQGIFYARFKPREGRKIVAQCPSGFLSTGKSATVDFDVLQEYIIPRKAFCNRYITTTDPSGRYAVLGHPVLLADARYVRNEFIFNFGVVVNSASADFAAYEQLVRRLAATFAEMERQSGYLSRQDGCDLDEGHGETGKGVAVDDGGKWGWRPIEGLLEIIKEDLNLYGECMIPVDDANTINMKLFPHHKTPPDVKGWHVPVAKTKLSEIIDPTWDITLQRIGPFIDGASDVRRIAHLAGVSLPLARAALRHLLYYDTILLLDMFFFGSVYAVRPGIHDFVRDVDGVVAECAAYACLHARQRLDPYHLIRLMTSFCVGRSVMDWLRAHRENGLDVLRYLDVRRFVQFGVIKGYLYRVHKYVISKQYLAGLVTGAAQPRSGVDPLQQYTDGCHTFDQIITEQDLTDGEIMERLKTLPVPNSDLTIMYR